MLELNKNKWWTGFWDSSPDPPDGCWFMISKKGYSGEACRNYLGCHWTATNYIGYNAWIFHLKDYSHKTKPMIQKLGLSHNEWRDEFITHPGIKVIDENGEEECAIIRKAKWEKGLYK